MNTLFHFFGTVYGALALSLFVAALVAAGVFLWRRRQQKLASKREQDTRDQALSELSKQEKQGREFFKAGKFQLAEANFLAAAVKAGELGDQYRQWKNQHHAFVTMSRTESGRVLAALQGLQKLVAELTIKLPPKDALLVLAQQNLAKIETNGLNQAAERDFARATEFYEADKLEQARAFYQQAYRAAQHAKNPILCALILNDCSRVPARNKQFDEAIKMLEKARKIAEANCEAGHELPANIAWNLDYYRSVQQETSVRDLLAKTKAAHYAHKQEEAMELAGQVVALAYSTLKADHWLTGEALHYRACIKMGQGFYSEARADFDQVLRILCEWPEQCAKLIELATTNLEKCRNDMGY